MCIFFYRYIYVNISEGTVEMNVYTHIFVNIYRSIYLYIRISGGTVETKVLGRRLSWSVDIPINIYIYI